MKLPANCKIELAASTDSARYVLLEPYLDVAVAGEARTGTLVATNGMIMAMLPVELGEHDAAGHVGLECLKAARKVAGKNGTMDMALNGKAEIGAVSMPRTSFADREMTYPNWRQVQPVAADDDIVVSFDVALLWKLAQALGTEAVTLRIPNGGEKPILVKPAGKLAACPEARGVLMPMRMS